MEEISVIRATDPDGSVFKAVMDALSGKRAEVVDVANQSASVLRIGDLEIYCNQHRAFMAGREVVLNHGEYAPVHQGRCSPKRSSMRPAGGEEYLSGTNSVENTIWRLKRKLEPDPKHPDYIKTVLRAGYKMNNPMNKVVNLRSD